MGHEVLGSTPRRVTSDLFSVEGRVIIVTGAGRGNGAAIAAGLARAGAYVYGLDLRYDSTEISYHPNVCDVTDETAVERLVESIVRDRGRIDGLVNNAGISLPAADCYSRDHFLTTLSVNTLAPFRLGWMVAQVMKRPDGDGGSIVNVTSLGAHLGFPDNPTYQASKAALRQITRALAVDFGARGVRVNNLCPGYIVTAMTHTSHTDPATNAARSERMILDRWGRPEDLVGPCQFLLSDASRYVTGIDLPVDGGWLAKGL
jgi:NAD(P)-dependent dehydrogenase (short-subunit alcohol dehydrogenase family)